MSCNAILINTELALHYLVIARHVTSVEKRVDGRKIFQLSSIVISGEKLASFEQC